MSHAYFAAFRTYVNQLGLSWRKTQRDNLLRFGTAVLTCRSLPLRRLARALSGPGKEQCAPDKRLRRFLGNECLNMDAALAAHLAFQLRHFGAVPFICVMVDWTFVDEKAILWAHIPYRGRSLPLCCSVHARCLEDNEVGQTKAEQALLQRLRKHWPAWAPPPLLLADRGFDKGPLLRWLVDNCWLFIVRIQRGHHLYDAADCRLNDEYDAQGRLVRRGPLHPEPGRALLFPNVTYTSKQRLPLHLVVSAALDPKTAQVTEWRLITNLEHGQLSRVAKLYAFRMPPEETFRDSKRGHFVSGFALSHLGRMRTDRLERLVNLFSIVYCCVVLVAETERETRQWLCKKHWGLSLLTFGLDLLRKHGSKARHLVRQACASIRFEPLWD